MFNYRMLLTRLMQWARHTGCIWKMHRLFGIENNRNHCLQCKNVYASSNERVGLFISGHPPVMFTFVRNDSLHIFGHFPIFNIQHFWTIFDMRYAVILHSSPQSEDVRGWWLHRNDKNCAVF